MTHDLSTNPSRRTASARRGAPVRLAATLTVFALAIPAAAAAYPVPEPASSAPEPARSAAEPASYSSLISITGPSSPERATSSLNSIAGPQLPHGIEGPVAARGHRTAALPDSALVTSETGGGSSFDWGDAAIGAGAVLALVALAGAGVTFRRRGTVSPRSVPSQG